MLSDPTAERAVLSGIYHHGSSVYYDIVDFIGKHTFEIDSNACIFKCLKYILEKDDSVTIDLPSIHSAAQEVGLSGFFYKKNEANHLNAILNLHVDKNNVKKFASKLRKLEIARLLKTQLGDAQDKLLNVTGDETLANILGLAEDAILDFSSLLNDEEDASSLLGNNISEYLKHLSENPVEQMGVSTGFPVFDKSIGGGLRKGTVNVIGARPKAGKSTFGCNVGQHIANKLSIPVLNLDTEMTKEDHIHRILAMLTEVHIETIETGKFSQKPDTKWKVLDMAKKIDKMPYFHKSIAGRQFEDQLALMRRWLIKDVGLHDDGVAKDCVIIYDYLKLMDTGGLNNLQEYQMLGFMMTTLHNFAVRYKVPILAFIQLNRDGITKESTDAASGSDRIIWLCSNFSILKRKSDEELAEDGKKNGNCKIVPVVARHGEGLEDMNYINCHFYGWCAKMVEGKTKFELSNIKTNEGFIVDGQQNGNKNIKF